MISSVEFGITAMATFGIGLGGGFLGGAGRDPRRASITGLIILVPNMAAFFAVFFTLLHPS